jgi:hypothetical protein
MPNKKVEKLTPEQAAEKARPNWKAVAPFVTDAARRVEADETAPELDQLKRKYLGEKAAPAGVKEAPAPKGKAGDLKIVPMEPKAPSDSRVGRKAVLVDEDGEIVGEQG